METVGQLHEDDTDVFGHRDEHFAEILRLFFFAVVAPVDLGDLGDAFHQIGDLFPEKLLDVVVGIGRVLNDVVQDSGHEGLLVQFQLGKDQRDIQGMDDIGLAGTAHLVFVRVGGQAVRLLDQSHVLGGMIAADLADQAREQFFFRRVGFRQTDQRFLPDQLFHGLVRGQRALAFQHCFLMLICHPASLLSPVIPEKKNENIINLFSVSCNVSRRFEVPVLRGIPEVRDSRRRRTALRLSWSGRVLPLSRRAPRGSPQKRSPDHGK